MFEINNESQSLPENLIDGLKKNDEKMLRHLYISNYPKKRRTY